MPSNGHNLGIATTTGSFSTSANTRDMVLRSINNLFFMELVPGACASMIRTNYNVGIVTNNPNNVLQVKNTLRLRISNGTTDFCIGKFRYRWCFKY